MKKIDHVYQFPVVIERDKNGYFAMCPNLQGCYSQGATYEEVLKNITTAIRLHVKDRKAENEKVEQSDTITLSTVKVLIV